MDATRHSLVRETDVIAIWIGLADLFPTDRPEPTAELGLLDWFAAREGA
jgi:hypothetical protein